jgi:peptidoglycan/LPS O-acetylase OafA/YrhL
MASRPLIPLPEHIPALDGLRGIAILLVLAFHTELLPTLKPLARDGWAGVDLFFVLSGFLITRILLKSRNSPRYFTNFYARRILRIWPVYFGILLFVFASERYGLLGDSATIWGWISLATFTQNFYIGAYGWNALPDWLGPTWSLGIEEQFYLIWPLLVRKLSLSSLKKLCMAVIFVTPLIRAVVSYYLHQHSDSPLILTFCRIDSLCFGTLLAIGNDAGDLTFHQWLKRLAIPALALFVILDRFASQFMRETLSYSLLAIFFAGTIAFSLTSSPGTLSRSAVAIFSFTPLRFVGKISYCLYLVHRAAFALAASNTAQQILNHFPGYNHDNSSQLLANWCFAFLLATLSWYLYESPILRLKRRFVSDLNPAETRAASAF